MAATPNLCAGLDGSQPGAGPAFLHMAVKSPSDCVLLVLETTPESNMHISTPRLQEGVCHSLVWCSVAIHCRSC